MLRLISWGIVTIYLVFTCSGCALSPLVNGQGARSLPRGEIELTSYFSGYEDRNEEGQVLIPSVRVGYGATDSVDVGMQTELKTYGFYVKHSVYQTQEEEKGASLAWQGLLGDTGAGNYYYSIGVVGSYYLNKFEPFLSVRYNSANLNPDQFDSSFFDSPVSLTFAFTTVALGLKYALIDDLYLISEVNTFIESQDVDFHSPAIFTFGMGMAL